MNVAIPTLAIGLLVLGAANAQGASFNCEKARLPDEHLICADDELSAADFEMAQAYGLARKAQKNAGSLLKAQRSWIVHRRNECLKPSATADKVDCLKQLTYRRRDELQALAPAAGQDRHSQSRPSVVGQRIIGRCHMEVCSWFTISDRETVGASGGDRLLKLNLQFSSSEHPGGDYEVSTPISDEGADTLHAFCSISGAALISSDGSRYLASHLAPGADDGIYGYNESSYMIYFAACHDIVLESAHDQGEVGRQLGYRISADALGDIPISRPEEMLE